MAQRVWFVPFARLRVAALAGVLLPACGPSDAADGAGSDADGPIDSGTDAPDSSNDSSGDASSDSAPDSCSASHLGGAVAAAQPGDVCTSVLRLSETGSMYSVTCGPKTAVTQTSAEALFSEPGYGPPYWALASGALPEAYVFFHDPMDTGGVAVVSGQTGMLAVRVKTTCCVGGRAGGDIADPPSAKWSPPPLCRSNVVLPTAKGLLLGGGQIPTSVPLDSGAIADAMQQLSDTPLADELSQRASVNFILVLDNKAAGRIVVLESTPLGP